MNWQQLTQLSTLWCLWHRFVSYWKLWECLWRLMESSWSTMADLYHCSVQDTTVCLLALTQYMKLTGSNPQNTITLSSEESEEVFYVNRNKRLLVQHSKVSKGHQQYTVDVEGDGCSFIQVLEAFLTGELSLSVRIQTSVQLCVMCFVILTLPVSCFSHIFLINSRKCNLHDREVTHIFIIFQS